MNDSEIGTFMRGIAGNWPSAKMPPETLDLWTMILPRLSYEEALETLWAEFGDSEFPPAPLHLSKRALARRRPPVSAEELVAELQAKIASVGYTSTPSWSHPALERYVHSEGGWVNVCIAGKAASSPDYGNYYAHVRNALRICIDRTEDQPAHSALGAGPAEELE